MTTTKTRLGEGFLSNYWKHISLGILILLGVVSMSGYKISVSGGKSWFIFLVLFTELAAGLTMFSQGFLRSEDPEAARVGYRLSITFRILMAGIGLSLFLEQSDWEWVPSMTEERLTQILESKGLKEFPITFSDFLTYEIANGLMLLVEYIFAHLIASRPQMTPIWKWMVENGWLSANSDNFPSDPALAMDAVWSVCQDRQKSTTLTEVELKRVQGELQQHQENSQKWITSTQRLSEITQTEDQDIQIQVQNIQSLIQDSQTWVSEISKTLRLQSEDPGEILDSIQMAVKENRRLTKILSNVQGRSVVVSGNERGFVCPECSTWNQTHNRTKSLPCSNCGTELINK